MIALRIAFLFVAAAVLAGCAIPVRTDPAVEERLVIRGEMLYPEQVALTPDSVAIDDGLRGSAERAGNPLPGSVAEYLPLRDRPEAAASCRTRPGSRASRPGSKMDAPPLE